MSDAVSETIPVRPAHRFPTERLAEAWVTASGHG